MISKKMEEALNAQINAEMYSASNIFLQWFVTEQVEEESNAASLLAKLKMVGDNVQGLFMMDQELGQRVAGAVVVPGDGVTGSAAGA